MAGDPRVRASDADRDWTAAALREHLAAGRLTTEEFEERLDKIYAAKTLGELDGLMADLPATDPGPLPSTSLDRSAARPPVTSRDSGRSIEAGQGRFPAALRGGWGPWIGISLFLFLIWLASGAGNGLWFLWAALALGALMLGRRIGGGPGRSERRAARRRHYRHYGGW
jgi:hypothetical protein